MFEKLFRKKEIPKDNLEKARLENLITDEELLELRVKRANQRLKEYQENQKKRK